MAVSSQHKLTLILGGAVLLLAGALVGALLMAVRLETKPSPNTRPSAEQVVLGRQMVVPSTVDSLPPIEMPPPSAMNDLFRLVAGRVTPSVVYMEIAGGTGSMLPREFMHPFDDEGGSRGYDVPRQSVGSGVIVTEEGHVVTNFHVVEGADDIRVTLTDKRQYEAKVVGVDPSTDLAVVQMRADHSFTPAAIGDSDSLTVGEWVLAVGNPFRLTSTVTAGIVSALGRRVNIIEDEYGIEDFIQTDAAINPGNSGGALVNMRGELVGISTAIATESGSYEGYGFAVPANLMQRVARDLIEYGEVQRAILGVQIEEVSARLARANGLSQPHGVLLHDVSSGGAADQAGLRRGDIVLRIQDRSVAATNELQREIARYRPGDMISVDVLRDGERRRFDVQLLGRDDPSYADWMADLRRDRDAPSYDDMLPEDHSPGSIELSDWGIGFRELERRDARAFGEAGAYIAYVRRGSAAARSGLPRDVVIVEVDDRPVESIDAVVNFLRNSPEIDESVLFSVRRRDGIAAFYEVDVPRQ